MSHKDQAAGDPEGYQLEVVQYGPQVDQEDHEQPWLFTFLHCPGIDATNNAGEREMRPAVIARKTWGGNRSEAGAEAQRTLMSVLRTCYRQGKDAFERIVDLLRSATPVVLDIVPLGGSP